MSDPTPKPSPDKILVLVHDGRWDCYGDSLTNPHQQYLYGVLKGMGGVNHSVPPGWHEFWIETVLGVETAHLEPYYK